MFPFLLKKAFFDGWDRLFELVLLNVAFGFLLLVETFLAFSLLAASQGPATVLLQLLLLALASLPLGLHSGAVSWMAREAASGASGGFKAWLEGLRRTWPKALAAGPLSVLVLLAGLYGLGFYARSGGILGWTLAALLFWILLALCLLLLYLFPLLARSEGPSLLPALKRDALFVLDNLPFSLALLGVTALSLPLSVLTFGLFPGPAWAILLSAEALQLRMRKYDWQEANPGADRRSPPWTELLAPDRELLGERSLKGFFFPWKDAR